MRAKNEVCQLCSAGSRELLADWSLHCCLFSCWPQTPLPKTRGWCCSSAQLGWTYPTAPANSAMPEGCAWRKVPLTRQGGHNGHRAAFSFQHLMPALQQQGLLPNELCTEAKTAGSVPQAAKQHGWKEDVLQSLRGTLLREGPTVVPPGVDCAGGSRWGQALGTPLHSVKRALLEVISQSSAQCQTSLEAEMPWTLFTHLKRINFALRCNVSPST